MPSEPTIPLTLLPRELKARTGRSTTYRRVYTLALDGRLPAEQGENGRWRVRERNVQLIAEELGLTGPAVA